MTYRTIVADPPWRYGNPRGTKAGAGYVYDTMSLDEIKAMPVGDLAADDAHLWVWGTNMKLDWAYEVARAWGFDPVTLATWCKKQPGVGAYLRNNTEHVLLATRGKPITPPHKPIASWFVWPRAEHSKKPDAFYDLVEQVSPGPWCEVFSRRNRLGWDYRYHDGDRAPAGSASPDDGESFDGLCACGRVRMEAGIVGALHAGVYHRVDDDYCVRADDGYPVRAVACPRCGNPAHGECLPRTGPTPPRATVEDVQNLLTRQGETRTSAQPEE